MVSREGATTIAYLAGVAGVIGIGAYAVYSLLNPGTPGGKCTTPGTPCNTAISPYQQQYQNCANQYTQLMTSIIQGGNAPTAAQQADLQQLQNCMDDAAANIAKTAQQFVPTNSIASLVQDIGEAILVAAIAYYGLKGLGSALAQYRASGKVTTGTTSGSDVANIIFDSSIQYAVESSQISSSLASAWIDSVSSNVANSITENSFFYNTLSSEAILSVAEATADYNIDTSTMNADAGTTISDLSGLSALGYASYGYAGYVVSPNAPVVPAGVQSGIGAMSYPAEAPYGCGCG